MKSKLKQILKIWAVVTVSTFLLCFLTQHGAKILFNIDLPEQGGLEEFRKMIGLNWRFALNVALAVFILPPVEELLFRFLAFRMIARKAGGEWRSQGFCLAAAFASSVVFTAVHYIQADFLDSLNDRNEGYNSYHYCRYHERYRGERDKRVGNYINHGVDHTDYKLKGVGVGYLNTLFNRNNS